MMIFHIDLWWMDQTLIWTVMTATTNIQIERFNSPFFPPLIFFNEECKKNCRVMDVDVLCFCLEINFRCLP